MNWAALNMGLLKSLQGPDISSSEKKYLEMRLLDHMLDLFLFFLEIIILFSLKVHNFEVLSTLFKSSNSFTYLSTFVFVLILSLTG